MELLCVYESQESKNSNDTVSDSEKKETDVETPNVAIGSGKKSGGLKENGHAILNSVCKIVSQIKKPTHRRSGSPINWFPRKKADSYLKRKIKLFQENKGMNLSLDETLGNANPHYTKIAREKIAAREATRKAMAARKNALVEASWCRILKAARIQSKEAEAELEKAQRSAAEAFEAARAKGVMMYDKPDSPRKLCEVESYSSIGGKSTHTVTASFETAFDVDKEVMAAIKKAFIQYANCPGSCNKEEFKDLLWKVSQNPENNENGLESSDISSELVNAMLYRLENLQDDELASLATTVATCGLNAALLKLEHSNKDHGQRATAPRRISSANRFIDGYLNKKEPTIEVPSLDKYLVKHISKLEKEVLEARNSTCRKTSELELKPNNVNGTSLERSSDLGSILVKHVSKLEREVQEAKKSQRNSLSNDEYGCTENVDSNMQQSPLKHMSRLERAKLEDLNSPSLDKILVKPVHKLERDKMETLGKDYVTMSSLKKRNQQLENVESLDEILVKRQSKLEKEKLAAASQQSTYENIKNRKHGTNGVTDSDSLDKILVKRKPEIEKVKNNSEDYVKPATWRKEARERELQEAWGGLSLGNSIKPHLSRLERDRAAWKIAEEKEGKAKQVVK